MSYVTTLQILSWYIMQIWEQCIYIHIFFFVSSTMARGVNTIIMLVNTSSYPYNIN